VDPLSPRNTKAPRSAFPYWVLEGCLVLSQDELVSGVRDDGNPCVGCFLAPSGDASAALPDWFAARLGCVGVACAFVFVSTVWG
jgi:hypothetical protein